MQRRADTAKSRRASRAWLPDADLDAHPVCTWLLEMGFDLWIRTLYDRETVLSDDFRLAPGTLIACNHQRDVDGPMLGTMLVRRKHLRLQWPLPFYATREDLFRPGILARLTVHWPRPLSALLGHISLAWFFPLGRAEPMRRVREFTLGETLRALVEAGRGGDTCRTLLNVRGLRELHVSGDLPLHALLAQVDPALLEHWWGLRRLRLAALRAIAPGFRKVVADQLAHLAERLENNRCVYFSPEGTLSRNGHFGRIRAGIFRLARVSAVPPRIQPMALGYDSLAPGRARVVVRIGECFRADAALDRRTFDASLRHAILSLAPITPSHLLARYLLHGPAAFSQDELAGWLTRSLTALDAQGASLDPLWSRVPIPELVGRRLRWLVRKQLASRDSGRFRNLCPRDAAPGWRTPAGIVRYLDNSLSDLVPDPDRTLPC